MVKILKFGVDHSLVTLRMVYDWVCHIKTRILKNELQKWGHISFRSILAYHAWILYSPISLEHIH